MLDQKIAELEQQIDALRTARAALGGGSPRAAAAKAQPGRRQFTAAQREEISRRMRATWAKRKQVLESAGKPAAAKASAAKSGGSGKRRLSPEGRARIAEAARRRWAAHRKQHGGS